MSRARKRAAWEAGFGWPQQTMMQPCADQEAAHAVMLAADGGDERESWSTTGLREELQTALMPEALPAEVGSMPPNV